MHARDRRSGPWSGRRPGLLTFERNVTLTGTIAARIARASDVCYDSICFDVNRFSNNDCPIVRLNHESILCNDELSDIQLLLPSFRDLIFAVLDIAD